MKTAKSLPYDAIHNTIGTEISINTNAKVRIHGFHHHILFLLKYSGFAGIGLAITNYIKPLRQLNLE